MNNKANIYGYIRVSTTLQNDDRQWMAMDEFGVARERVFVDKQSGKDFDRPAYQDLLGSRSRSSMQTSRIPTCREGKSEVEKEAT